VTAPSSPGVPSVGLARRVGYARFPVAVSCAYRLVVGGLISAPAIGNFDRLLRHTPGGDRQLFANGGALLIETLWHFIPSTGALLRHAGLVGLVSVLIGLVPLAWTLHALGGERRPRPRAWFAAGLRSLPTFVAILGAASLAEVLLVAMALAAVGVIAPSFETPTRALVGLSVVAAVLVPAGVATIVRDLAFSASASRDARFYDAAVRALVVLRRRPFAVVVARIVAACASTLFFASGVAAPVALGMSGTPRWLLVALIEQLSIAGLVVVRATYLARLTAIDVAL
jgi:hypothetical protein